MTRPADRSRLAAAAVPPGAAWRTGAVAALAALVLAACGGGKDAATADPGSPDTGSSAPAPSPTPAPAPGPAPAPAPAPSPTAGTLQLPLEVLGDGSPATPVVAEALLTVDAAQLANVSQLWFKCHRCGFFGAPEYEATTRPVTRIKASVRVLGGTAAADAAGIPWVDITDANVTLPDVERLQGGLNGGGFYTTRISLALDAAAKARLVAGAAGNRVQFRFNGTDGESNGYRVVALELRNAQGTNVATNPVAYADIQAEKLAGKALTDAVAAGEALWTAQGTLAKSPLVDRKIQAACGSCHAATGRDLQYFNYSNNAIVQRSRFHGLTAAQGAQIAAYVRYTQQAVPHVAQAAPWNPPYQPGAGLDSKPVTEWSAGAGLGAVLETPAQAMNALFGRAATEAAPALSQAEVDAVMDADATMNTREIPVPLQYPDWNAWLPSIHPLDVWPEGGSTAGSFVKGAQFSNGNRQDPAAAAARIQAWLTANLNPNGRHGDWSHLTPAKRKEIKDQFTNFGWTGYNFLGGGRGNHVAATGEYGAQVGGRLLAARKSATTTAAAPEAATTNAFIERAVMSMLHWNVIRQWDWAQTYGLEGDQRWFLGDLDTATNTWKGRGEVRGWPFNTVSLFFLGPHMLYQADTDGTGRTTREWYMAWEAGNKVGSYYRTNIWYQMQMSVNPGAQSDWVNFSMDWPYLTGFDELLSSTVGTATPAAKQTAMLSDVRLLQARIKGAQFVNNAIPLYVASDTGSLINNRGRFGRAQTLKHFTPTVFMDRSFVNFGTSGTVMKRFDELSPGLHLKVVNGAIRQFNTLYTGTDPAAWRRCDPLNTDLGEAEPTAGFAFCVDTAKRALPMATGGGYAMNTDQYARPPQEQSHQYGLWKAAQMGAEPQRLQQWAAWVGRIWP